MRTADNGFKLGGTFASKIPKSSNSSENFSMNEIRFLMIHDKFEISVHLLKI